MEIAAQLNLEVIIQKNTPASAQQFAIKIVCSSTDFERRN